MVILNREINTKSKQTFQAGTKGRIIGLPKNPLTVTVQFEYSDLKLLVATSYLSKC